MIRRFNRFELKYILPLTQSARLMDELREHISPDRQGAAGGYPVVSLYYDSPDFECFWSKIEGLKYRRKVRLRIYPGQDIRQAENAAVEIKQRINKTVQKRRLSLPLARAEALCEGEFELDGLDALDSQVAREVLFLRHSLALRPTAITAYQRRAFEGSHENAGLRVTFDTQVAARMHALQVNESAINRLIVPEDWCIVEVKANERVPEWVASLLARHRCQLGRISKYCAGVAQIRNFGVLPLALHPRLPFPVPSASPVPANPEPPEAPLSEPRHG
ncbi:MAG TPA: polyphosphate polymerase domain-containing protein [Polyangiaceae bacterium]|nr:polyphosphate polymerase domain-containing protein [Polyangiaceae bacterium]